MRGSFKLVTVAGIGLHVHWTFAILIAGLPLLYVSTGSPWPAAVEGLLFILAIFLSVVLHEYGHALTARRYGIPTKDITLLPIGGIARLQRIPEEPRQELSIALAGPAVNVAIALTLFAIGGAAGRILPPESVITAAPGAFISRLAWINLALVVFNMLPAFPMDGGRVLRAFLAMRMDYLRATEIAAGLGKIMAVAFGLLAFFGNFFLLFIALFVYLGAQQEAQHTRMRSLTRGLTAGQAMMTRFERLSPDQTLRELIGLLGEGYQQDFVVVTDGQPVGILPRAHLLHVLPAHDEETPVGKVMVREFKTIDAAEVLSEAFERMQASGHPLLPVLQRGELVGVLTPGSIGQFVMMNAALKQAPGFPFRQSEPPTAEIHAPHTN